MAHYNRARPDLSLCPVFLISILSSSLCNAAGTGSTSSPTPDPGIQNWLGLAIQQKPARPVDGGPNEAGLTSPEK